MRLHLNAKDLNAATQIEHHGTLTLKEILVYLKDAKVFSLREKKCGYRNVVPGKESINLTTFERHRFRRMPFSLKISQEFFQTKRDQIFLVTQTAKLLNSSPGTSPQYYEFECFKDNYSSARRDVRLTQGSLIPKEHSLY